MHVIVQYKTQPDFLENTLLSIVKGTVLKRLSVLNTDLAEVPGYSLEMLATDPNVSYISLDRKVSSRQFFHAQQST